MQAKLSRRKKNRYMALFMAAVLVITTAIVYPSMTIATGKNAVKFEVGISNLPITLSYDKKIDSGKSDEAGRFDSETLYQYLNELGWENEEEKEPEVKSVTVHYEINFPNAKNADERESLGGDPHYKGAFGDITIEYNPENPLEWKEKINVLLRPEEEVSLSGKVMIVPFGKTKKDAKPLSNAKVYLKDTESSKLTDLAGNFVFYGYSKKTNPSAELVVDATDEHTAASVKLSRFTDKLYVYERPGVAENDYTVVGAVNGYVKKPQEDTKYTVKALNGRKLSLKRDGEQLDEIEITLSSVTHFNTPFYVYRDGICSSSVVKAVKIDQTAPSISDIQTKAANKEVKIKDHGIYTTVKADLLITLSVVDKESGVGEIDLIGIGENGEKTVYKTTNVTKSSGKTTATFVIESQKEMMKQTLYLDATDKVGNKSEEVLLRGNKDASDLTLEIIPPIVSDIKVTNAVTNKNGWYNESLDFECAALDAESGISEITAMVDDKVLYSKSFDKKVMTEEKIKFSLSKELVKEIRSKTGEYTVVVKVTDNCGNISTKNLKVKVDVRPPVVTLTGIADGEYVNKVPELVASETEDYVDAEGNSFTVTVYRNDKNIYKKSFANQISKTLPSDIFEPDGKYKVVLNATDAAGNHANTLTRTFLKDSSKPEVGDMKATNAKANKNGWYKEPLQFKVTSRDFCAGMKSVKVTLGKNVLYSKEYEKNEAMEDIAKFSLTEKLIKSEKNNTGEYTIVLTAMDHAGNKTVKTEVVKVDITKPKLSISGVEEGVYTNTSPTVVFTEKDDYIYAAGNHIDVTVTRDGKKEFAETYHKTETAKIPESVFAKDGVYEIEAIAEDAAGNKSNTVKRSFTKDSTAPVVSIKGLGEGKYLNTPQDVTISVEELNFKNNNVFIKATKTLGNNTTEIQFPWENARVTSSSTINVGGVGTYTFSVYAEDAAGNKSETKQLTFTVDTVAPTLNIDGVADGKIYAYEDVVAPNVTFSDDYLEGKEITLTRAGQNWYSNLNKTEGENSVSFADFAKTKENDGVYMLTATVRDKAGNITTKTVTFIVNRFGSSFEFSDSVHKINGKAVKEVKEDLIVTEKNVSELRSTKNELIRDGIKFEKDNKKTQKAGTSGKYNVYTHKYTPDEFEKEGVYELNVISSDAAGNQMESQSEAGKLKFTVDKTKPNIRVYQGFRETLVNAEKQIIRVEVKDNLSKTSFKVYVNDAEIEPVEISENNFEAAIGKGARQKVKLVAEDAAGNKSVTEKTISIVPNKVKYFFLKYFKLMLVIIVAVSLYTANEIYEIKKEKEEQTQKQAYQNAKNEQK